MLVKAKWNVKDASGWHSQGDVFRTEEDLGNAVERLDTKETKPVRKAPVKAAEPASEPETEQTTEAVPEAAETAAEEPEKKTSSRRRKVSK